MGVEPVHVFHPFHIFRVEEKNQTYVDTPEDHSVKYSEDAGDLRVLKTINDAESNNVTEAAGGGTNHPMVHQKTRRRARTLNYQLLLLKLFIVFKGLPICL